MRGRTCASSLLRGCERIPLQQGPSSTLDVANVPALVVGLACDGYNDTEADGVKHEVAHISLVYRQTFAQGYGSSRALLRTFEVEHELSIDQTRFSIMVNEAQSRHICDLFVYLTIRVFNSPQTFSHQPEFGRLSHQRHHRIRHNR